MDGLRLLQDVYEVQVSENIAINSFVIRVAANDSDEPGIRNSRIEFSLEANDMFFIHRHAGQFRDTFHSCSCSPTCILICLVGLQCNLKN